MPISTKRLLGPLAQPFLDQAPASVLIRQTARQQWKLLALNLATSVLEAFSEGASLAVVFLAVQVLSSDGSFNWAANPLVGKIPGLVELMGSIPRTPMFLLLLLAAVLLQALQSSSRYLNAVSVGYFAARCRALVTARIHGQILRLTYACASGYRVGDLTDVATIGPEAVRIAIDQSSMLLLNGLLIAIYLAVLVLLSPWLLLMAVVLAGLISLIQRQLLPRIRYSAHQVSNAQLEIVARITEDIQGLRLLHSSGQLQAADRAVSARMGDLESSLRSQSRLIQLIGPVSNLLPIVAIAVIGAASLLVFGNKSSGILPSLVTFVLALQRLTIRLSSMANIFTNMSENAGRLGRLNGLLAPGGKAFLRDGGSPFKGLAESIRLEAVQLHYGGDGPAALNGIDLVLPRGSTMALVGPSGAGKSTIADLLVGLHEPSRGRVLVDGLDLRSIDLASWQQRIGVVSQDTFLFNLSLAGNIAFGTPGASNAHIQQAAQLAHAAGFIEDLPEGYDTVVGERGFRLSGGQRQRIALARAILRDPDLLILDEATSAMDSESERLVQEALEGARQERTVLVIAHRLSTVVNVDQIVVLERGRIVERGTHLELLARGGRYSGLWNLQDHSERESV
jgi:ATP-binding cassette subfamily B protein/subfamily B ATP-binding cassette protein MsbA